MWICNLYAYIVQHADVVACTQHQYANQTAHPEQLSDERIISYAQQQSNGTQSLLIGSKNHLRRPLSIEKKGFGFETFHGIRIDFSLVKGSWIQ